MGGALSKYHAAESLDIWLLVDRLHPQVLNKDLWGKRGPNAVLPQRTSCHGGHTLYLSPVAGQHSSSDLLQVSGQRESGVESTGFPEGLSSQTISLCSTPGPGERQSPGGCGLPGCGAPTRAAVLLSCPGLGDESP